MRPGGRGWGDDRQPTISIPRHRSTLQDCFFARRTGIIAGPCQQPRTAKRRPATGARWTIGSRVSWTRHSSRGSSRTSRRRRCISSSDTADSMRAASSSRLATPAQLTSLLDLDLWRHAQPGRDEQFDVDRFGEWLEVLVDTGHSVAARTVAALDEHLVIARPLPLPACIRPGHVRTDSSQSDDEPMDRNAMMNSETSGDVARVRSGRLSGAGATEPMRGTRSSRSSSRSRPSSDDYFHAVMQGCRRLSNSRPEIDGLDDLLMAPEQHLHDVAIERERRRSRQGYATPADARAFLQMARQPQGTRRRRRRRARSTPSPRPTFARSKKKRTPPERRHVRRCA